MADKKTNDSNCPEKDCFRSIQVGGLCRYHYDRQYKSSGRLAKKAELATSAEKIRSKRTSKKDSMDLITDLKDILEREVEVLKDKQSKGEMDFAAMSQITESIKKLSAEERLWRKEQSIEGLPIEIIEVLLPQAIAILQEELKNKQLHIINKIEEPNESDSIELSSTD